MIVERAPNTRKEIPEIDKQKYVPWLAQHSLILSCDITRAAEISPSPPQRTRETLTHAVRSTARRFLAPSELAVSKFVTEIRKHMSVPPEQSIYIFVRDNVMPQPALLMSQVYERHKDTDGFLYIQYSGEDIFGAQL